MYPTVVQYCSIKRDILKINTMYSCKIYTMYSIIISLMRFSNVLWMCFYVSNLRRNARILLMHFWIIDNLNSFENNVMYILSVFFFFK